MFSEQPPASGQHLTLFEKVWRQHEIICSTEGFSLLHVDRHLIHDLEAGPGLNRLARDSHKVARPDLTFATPDHAISSAPGRQTDSKSTGGKLLRDMRRGVAATGIRLFDIGGDEQGIVHIVGPELGITLPGSIVVCGDSHTCTHGGLGALAFGIGSSEVAHVLATQTLRQRRPNTMLLRFDGILSASVTAKDMILHAIGVFGTAAGRGCAIEFGGEAVRALDIEQRLTLCNLSIEMGAKIGMIAPDDVVYEYLAGRRFAPQGRLFDRAVEYWRSLASGDEACFDIVHTLDAGAVTPQITWGTSPQDVLPIDGRIPDPRAEADPNRRAAQQAALDYMGLMPGQPISSIAIDWVFIGSCANSRLSDLRAAASIVAGRRVASHVSAWVVPGSEAVRRAAESEGLNRIFIEAGFEWRAPSCSMCLAANGDLVPPGKRCVSTSNRNFVGRQGPGARTHLASPVTAAAAAIAGRIVDPRTMERT
ncbi:3-isopropylmalate dehydratase large subunit [Caballeronia sordidicola]|uniref:3-isopropylmalate dehydratase n=1 Tax=Caballeronia sordidicola TaxID=196367 RepID=A0A226WT95_CABSO|nr:3-isopropylmalate dehydratase large subunit [Caballeronia sordidicola]OXC74425.1 3-isopropylmalate dehydratase large subunit [Caballeronia sordidicola]